MKLRATLLLSTLLFANWTAQAQGQGQGNGNGNAVTLPSLSAELAALTARVAKLEGQITAADLVGTYAVHGFQNEMSAPNVGHPTAISSYVFVGTLTLRADGTAVFNGTESGHTLLFTAPPSVSNFQGSGSGTSDPFPWSYSGGVLTTLGGFPISVAAGGKVMVGASANHDDHTNVILIITRLN